MLKLHWQKDAPYGSSRSAGSNPDSYEGHAHRRKPAARDQRYMAIASREAKQGSSQVMMRVAVQGNSIAAEA